MNVPRLLLITLPFVLALVTASLSGVRILHTVSYGAWTAAWWVIGIVGVVSLRSHQEPVRHSTFKTVTFGAVCGIVAQLLAWAATVSTGLGSFLGAVPFGICAVMTLIPTTRGRLLSWRRKHACADVLRQAEWGSKGEFYLPTYALAAWSSVSSYLVIAAYASTRAQPIPPGTTTLYQDLFWHTGIAAELKDHVVPQTIESRTGTLNYHWLSDAFMAAGSLGAHVPTIEVATRLWVLPIILLSTALLVLVAHQVSGSWVTALPALLVVAFGSSISLLPVQAPGPSTTFAFLSPSQIFGVPMTLASLSLMVQTWRGRHISPRQMALLGAMFVVCTGSKSSIVPVFLGGALCSLAWTILHHRPGWQTTARVQGWTVALLTAALVIALPLFAGGSAGSRVRFLGHLRRLGVVTRVTGHPYELDHGPFWPPGLTALSVLVLVTLVVAVFFSYALAWTPLVILGRTKLVSDPIPVLLMGSVASAVAAFLLIDHTGQSESYFPMGAMPILALAFAWSFSVLWHKPPRSPWIDLWWGLFFGCVLIATYKFALQQFAESPQRPQAEKISSLLGWLIYPAWILAAAALFYGWRRHTNGMLATCVALAVYGTTGPGWLTVNQTFNGLTHPPTRTFTWSVRPAEWKALFWIREHTPRETLVATNVHCTDVVRTSHCAAGAYWTSALAERQMLIGGWGYIDEAQRRSGTGGYPAVRQAFPDSQLFALNEAAFYHPTASVMRQLKSEGVQYLFADSRVAPISPLLSDLAERIGSWGTATVYRMR